MRPYELRPTPRFIPFVRALCGVLVVVISLYETRVIPRRPAVVGLYFFIPLEVRHRTVKVSVSYFVTVCNLYCVHGVVVVPVASNGIHTNYIIEIVSPLAR